MRTLPSFGTTQPSGLTKGPVTSAHCSRDLLLVSGRGVPVNGEALPDDAETPFRPYL